MGEFYKLAQAYRLHFMYLDYAQNSNPYATDVSNKLVKDVAASLKDLPLLEIQITSVSMLARGYHLQIRGTQFYLVPK